MNDFAKKILFVVIFVLAIFAVVFVVYRNVTYDSVRVAIVQQRIMWHDRRLPTIRTHRVRAGDTIALATLEGWLGKEMSITIAEIRDGFVIIDVYGTVLAGDRNAQFFANAAHNPTLELERGIKQELSTSSLSSWIEWTLAFR